MTNKSNKTNNNIMIGVLLWLILRKINFLIVCIMTPLIWLTLFLVILCFGFLFEKFLEYLNVKNWKRDIPEQMKDYYPETKYEKSRLYHKEKGRISFMQSLISFIITFLALFFGWFGVLDTIVLEYTEDSFFRAAAFFTVLFLLAELLSLPFSIYNTFVVEQKYEFNKTTPATFILDKLKGYLLLFFIGGGLLYLAILTIEWFQKGYWLWLWTGMTVFMLLINMFYADVILPLFNKLSPLEEGSLKSEISQFAQKVGYNIKNIYIIDGSKRSTKANAFFSGLGPRKTIALYDTLIEKHTTQELVAVLAHEIGHYKKKHIFVSFLLSIVQTGITLFLFEYFLNQTNVSLALGGQSSSFHLGLIAFGLIFSPLGMLIGIGMNILSRKNEFEADLYAKENYNSTALSNALKKLSVDSLSNLYPHRAYVFVHYSHPPLLERLEKLKG